MVGTGRGLSKERVDSLPTWDAPALACSGERHPVLGVDGRYRLGVPADRPHRVIRIPRDNGLAVVLSFQDLAGLLRFANPGLVQLPVDPQSRVLVDSTPHHGPRGTV